MIKFHVKKVHDLGWQPIKSLNQAPHQWCSGTMIMTHVWICYPTVIWVLYEAWTISDRGGSPHTPLDDLQLHLRHAQLLPRFSKSRSWTVDLSSIVVVQGCSRMYGYAIPLLYECYMRHGPYLTVVDHPTDHYMTSNYTLEMLSYYPVFWNQELEPCTSSVV